MTTPEPAPVRTITVWVPVGYGWTSEDPGFDEIESKTDSELAELALTGLAEDPFDLQQQVYDLTPEMCRVERDDQGTNVLRGR